MANDVSNTTIAILLVLTILVSIVGTWTVLDAAKQVRPAPAAAGGGATDQGRVQLAIAGEPEPKTSAAADGGKVALVILK